MEQFIFVSLDTDATYLNDVPSLVNLAEISAELCDARRENRHVVLVMPNAPYQKPVGAQTTSDIVVGYCNTLGQRTVVVPTSVAAVRQNPVARQKLRNRLLAILRKSAVPILHQSEEFVGATPGQTDLLAATLSAGGLRDVLVLMMSGEGMTGGDGSVLDHYIRGQSYSDAVLRRRAEMGATALENGTPLAIACGLDGSLSHLLAGRRVGTLILLSHSVAEMERRFILSGDNDLEDSQDLTDGAVGLLRSLKYVDLDESVERAVIESKAETAWIEALWTFRQKATMLERRRILASRRASQW